MSPLITTQGRVLAISDPSVESSATHQISPQRGFTPGFLDLVADLVPLLFDGGDFRVLVCQPAGSNERLILFPQALFQGLGQKAGAVPRGYALKKLASQINRD